MDFMAWHGRTLADHRNLANQYQALGYGFISLSVYGVTSSPYYAGVMIRPAPAAQHHHPRVPRDEWQQVFDSEAAQGYGPVIIAATGEASSPLFAAVFEPQNPIPLTRIGLASAPHQDPSHDNGSNTIQAMNAHAKRQGLILRWAAVYGNPANPAFAAVWVPNPDQTLWNNDGVLDSADTYQGRLDAELSGWCRPAFVSLNARGRYFSVFVDNQIGRWQARHGLTPAEYESALDSFKQQGYFPLCVQAAGAKPDSATFAAVFATSRDVVAKSFCASGPIANARIDATIRDAMANYRVRHAGLAIVHGTRLVYARGYTLAEPDWPIAQPTTCFRLASISKTLTAIAIYQLLEERKLNLADTVQGILALETPAGSPPCDKRFNQVTIRQLLEHTSGLHPGGEGGFGDSVAVRDAFLAAGRPATLPVSAAMMDSYIASLPLQSNPGETQVYNNCAYYLLARVVARLRNQSRPMDAYQLHIFNPLSITRIRGSVSLVANQPPDEARYQNYDLSVFPSVMSDARPLVPDTYGNADLEAFGRAASGAPTDVARLIAILISQKDNPAITRAALVSMLTAGTKVIGAGNQSAGYGFDLINDLGGGRFHAHKLGFVGSCSGVLQFHGEWGFIMLWGSGRPRQLPNQPWYPDFPALMSVAQSTAWGSADLFPDFGMPSL